MRQRVAALVILLFGDSAARAGSYVNVALCEEASGCLLNTDVCHELCDPDCDDPDCSFVPPFAIVHPFGYTGAETTLQLRICLEGGDAAFGPTRGSGDDFHQAFGGPPAESVSWFRQADNDPFIVDATVIDIGTFSRSLSNLPPPDTWGASGHLKVALPKGYVESQAVMFGLYQRQQFYMNLLADDANMLKMARTGVDLMAGTADDYAVDLLYVGDCSNAHDLKVSVDPVPSGAFGICGNLRIDYSFDPGNPLLARHFSIKTIVPAAPLEIVLNDSSALDAGRTNL